MLIEKTKILLIINLNEFSIQLSSIYNETIKLLKGNKCPANGNKTKERKIN
jgi:hypothetical protein